MSNEFATGRQQGERWLGGNTLDGQATGLAPYRTIDGGQITGVIDTATVPGSQVTGVLTTATIDGSQITNVITTATIPGANVTGAITTATIAGANVTGPIDGSQIAGPLDSGTASIASTDITGDNVRSISFSINESVNNVINWSVSGTTGAITAVLEVPITYRTNSTSANAGPVALHWPSLAGSTDSVTFPFIAIWSGEASLNYIAWYNCSILCGESTTSAGNITGAGQWESPDVAIVDITATGVPIPVPICNDGVVAGSYTFFHALAENPAAGNNFSTAFTIRDDLAAAGKVRWQESPYHPDYASVGSVRIDGYTMHYKSLQNTY